MADTYDLGSYVVRHAGSSPVARTIEAVAVGQQLLLYPLFLSPLTGSRSPLRGVWCSETDANAVLIDLKPQAALFIILGELAKFRVLFGIREKSFLQVCVVGINFSKVIVFVVVNLSDLSLSSKSCFYKTSCNL